MNNWEISKAMRYFPSAKNRFIGVFPADGIPKNILNYPCCFIANTDPSWMPGTHWVAVYIDADGTIEYFDSYGRTPMSPQMKSFCGNFFRFNPYMIQPVFSSACGQFCIYFLVQRCRGHSFERVMKMFDFNNLVHNENLVKNFIKFNPKVCAKNNRCFYKQCCKPLKIKK